MTCVALALPLVWAMPARAATLALFPPQLPAMPDPPALERHLFESPWAIVLFLLFAAIVLFLGLRRAGKTRPALWSSLACLALAAGAWIASVLVVTPRERIAIAANDLVAATASADASTLRALLDPAVRVQSQAGSPRGAEQVIERVESFIPSWNIRSGRAATVKTALQGDDIAWSQVYVKIDAELVPPSSWWRLDWAKDPAAPPDDPWGGWRVTKIEPLWIPGVSNPGG